MVSKLFVALCILAFASAFVPAARAAHLQPPLPHGHYYRRNIAPRLAGAAVAARQETLASPSPSPVCGPGVDCDLACPGWVFPIDPVCCRQGGSVEGATTGQVTQELNECFCYCRTCGEPVQQLC